MSYLGGPTSPLEFIGRLAALVPRPRVKLRGRLVSIPRGVLTGPHPANSKLRTKVVPDKPHTNQPTDQPKGYGMTWAQRLKRVFNIEPNADR